MLQQLVPQCRSMTLANFLLAPIQRVTKYPLLLTKIIDATPDTDPTLPNLKQV